ncbi:MAG: hypothetical protein J3Q66DRAFT_344296 [Benniella sp.]|nr:MAG: hypothetical protein J3Q66DRAFT_344296 [Benniella sp.]
MQAPLHPSFLLSPLPLCILTFLPTFLLAFPGSHSASIFHHPSSTDLGIQVKHQGLQAVSVFFLSPLLLLARRFVPTLRPHFANTPASILIPSSTATSSSSSLDTSFLSSRDTSTNFNFLSSKIFPLFLARHFLSFCRCHMQTHTIPFMSTTSEEEWIVIIILLRVHYRVQGAVARTRKSGSVCWTVSCCKALPAHKDSAHRHSLNTHQK